jgi:hypothetical protein
LVVILGVALNGKGLSPEDTGTEYSMEPACDARLEERLP